MDDSSERGKRYRSSYSRARSLYRIPGALASNSILELFHGHPPLFEGVIGHGMRATLCKVNVEPMPDSPGVPSQNEGFGCMDYRVPLPFEKNSFDQVLLHRTLDDLARTSHRLKSTFDAQGLFERIARVLAPGGLVAGCINNRIGVKSVLHRVKRRLGGFENLGPAGHFTPQSLQRALVAANFTDIQLFILLPNCDEPLRLVDIDPKISKVVFRHELHASRQLWSRSGYFLRRLAVELGIYPRFEESVFFWAYNRC